MRYLLIAILLTGCGGNARSKDETTTVISWYCILGCVGAVVDREASIEIIPEEDNDE